MPIVDDGVAEGSETFTVEIYDIVGATPGTTSATWTITDQQYALTVQRAGDGTGIVTSTPAGIDCGSTCSLTVNDGTPVTLTATADAGSIFTGWTGACTGSGACVVTVDAATSVTATFDLAPALPSLSIQDTAVVEGVMGQLLFYFSSPTVVQTCWSIRHFDGTATRPADYQPNPGRTCMPAGITGPAATGIPIVDDGVAEGPETFTVEIYDIVGAVPGTTSATWTITDQRYAVNVTRDGEGAGSVSSSPAGIDCGPTCSVIVDDGTIVTLTATADAGSVFSGWTGACTGTSGCVITVDAAKSVTATFDLAPALPVLSIQDTAVVEGVMGQLVFFFSTPTVVETCWRVRHFEGSATKPADYFANPGQVCFPAGVSGPAATGIQIIDDGVAEGPETFAVEIYDLVGATPGTTMATWTITDQQYAVTVQRDGAGTGSVISTPAGIDCGGACSLTANDGTSITLTASPDVGSVFVGWTGACTGAGECVVTVDGAKSVTAGFAKVQFALMVTRSGAGGGTVSSSPGGIDCGATCTASLRLGRRW